MCRVNIQKSSAITLDVEGHLAPTHGDNHAVPHLFAVLCLCDRSRPSSRHDSSCLLGGAEGISPHETTAGDIANRKRRHYHHRLRRTCVDHRFHRRRRAVRHRRCWQRGHSAVTRRPVQCMARRAAFRTQCVGHLGSSATSIRQYDGGNLRTHHRTVDRQMPEQAPQLNVHRNRFLK